MVRVHSVYNRMLIPRGLSLKPNHGPRMLAYVGKIAVEETSAPYYWPSMRGVCLEGYPGNTQTSRVIVPPCPPSQNYDPRYPRTPVNHNALSTARNH